ncbi:MAG: stage II sporulation protein M [Deltaproteobacteria bacterium]|nr:stage II sporulation protein M [Deltaproteobacteria bacterium]
MDVNRFMNERRPAWQELEEMLGRLEAQGWPGLGLERARRFGKLYRAASSDLIQARTATADAAVVDYLNDLVARAYGAVYAGRSSKGRAIRSFFAVEFPRLVREEARLVVLAASILVLGGAVGATSVALDPSSESVMIPAGHGEMRPEERVAQDEAEGPHGGDTAAAFGGFLFTHNMQVSFFVFALGITWGVGTVLLLFYNGVPLGALAVQYHLAGKGLFFWAWILPHGIPELTSVFISGAAGLVLARALIAPGRLRRNQALVNAAKRAVRMVLGVAPLLCVAGLIEATISQMHAPVMPYAVKLAFAACVAVSLFAYLGFAGRRR